MRYLIITAFLFTGLSCQNNDHSKELKENSAGEFVSSDMIIKNGNITTTFSSDTGKLGKLLNFNYYKPAHVKFQYTFIDNSTKDVRQSVPGPSDFQLEAVLFFDSSTFSSIRENYSRADWSSPRYSKEEFKFNWLDGAIKNELERSDSNYHGHIDLFWTYPNDRNCHLWLLDKKILLHRFSK